MVISSRWIEAGRRAATKIAKTLEAGPTPSAEFSSGSFPAGLARVGRNKAGETRRLTFPTLRPRSNDARLAEARFGELRDTLVARVKASDPKAYAQFVAVAERKAPAVPAGNGTWMPMSSAKAEQQAIDSMIVLNRERVGLGDKVHGQDVKPSIVLQSESAFARKVFDEMVKSFVG